jgi:hypothetical protein
MALNVFTFLGKTMKGRERGMVAQKGRTSQQDLKGADILAYSLPSTVFQCWLGGL